MAAQHLEAYHEVCDLPRRFPCNERMGPDTLKLLADNNRQCWMQRQEVKHDQHHNEADWPQYIKNDPNPRNWKAKGGGHDREILNHYGQAASCVDKLIAMANDPKTYWSHDVQKARKHLQSLYGDKANAWFRADTMPSLNNRPRLAEKRDSLGPYQQYYDSVKNNMDMTALEPCDAKDNEEQLRYKNDRFVERWSPALMAVYMRGGQYDPDSAWERHAIVHNGDASVQCGMLSREKFEQEKRDARDAYTKEKAAQQLAEREAKRKAAIAAKAAKAEKKKQKRLRRQAKVEARGTEGGSADFQSYVGGRCSNKLRVGTHAGKAVWRAVTGPKAGSMFVQKRVSGKLRRVYL